MSGFLHEQMRGLILNPAERSRKRLYPFFRSGSGMSLLRVEAPITVQGWLLKQLRMTLNSFGGSSLWS